MQINRVFFSKLLKGISESPTLSAPFAFGVPTALDSEIIPVKRKINILIRLLLQQLQISKVEVVKKMF